MSVQIQSLSKIYGEQIAVNNISFEIKEGEILGFLGPNGAGKSTTMKMITGYLPPSSGQVLINGINMQTHPIEGRKQIGYLPENNPLYKEMYVKEYLHFIAGIYQLKSSRTAVQNVIEMTGLGLEQNKKIHQLSKGYKQRVGLAQALIHDPKILILDEPTTGLDPNQLGEIRKLITELGKSKTIIFSTHIMQEVQAVCNKVIIIQKGNIVANNTVQGLSQQLLGANTILFTLERPIDTNLFRQIEFITAITQTDNSSYQMSGTDIFRMKRALFDLASKQDNAILQLSDYGTNLEDVFKSLTHTN
ncbi:MAG: gliding motility-associated ABC transporter ATP-binding subunit GldA [Chitinophagales bacterium]|nr:gliding motility-associated ABC transporter ATP-binding subunit GldA [Chitinophagales bacterium]MCZ2392480.1 gliding motility-associated ABC transporter ATP-binding subunit GldA [Chitinophagales bacterium]